MKVFGFLVALLCINSIELVAQKESPVSWKFDIKKTSDADYVVTATATMKPSWVLYSQFTSPDGPIPTLFMVNGSEAKFVEESKVIKEHDEMFDVEVSKFKEVAIFTYKGSKAGNAGIKGSVEYMICDGERCLPPVEVKFELKY
jgi:hypothetical protein